MKKKRPYLEIGNRLKKLRKNLSQKEFAEKIGIPLVTYQKYDSGERMPPGPVLSRVAELCGKTVDWILGRDLESIIAKEKEEYAARKEADKEFWEKSGESITKWGIPIPEEIDPKELLKIIMIYAKHGINIVELIKEFMVGKVPGYTEEERLYVDKLLEIFKGSNKKNISAIKENIDAFYETRNVTIQSDLKKANDAG